MERLLILGSTKCFLSSIHQYKPYFLTITVTEEKAALYIFIYIGLNTQISEQSL